MHVDCAVTNGKLRTAIASPVKVVRDLFDLRALADDMAVVGSMTSAATMRVARRSKPPSSTTPDMIVARAALR